MSSRTSRAISGSFTSLIQYALIMVLQFLLVPLIISFSNQETLGLYSYLLQIIGWAALSDMGFGVAAGRYLAQSNDLNDNHQRFKIVFKNSRTFYLVSNIIFSAIILLIAYKLEFLINDLDKHLLSDAKTGLYLFSIWGLVRTPFLLYGDALIATQFMTKNNIAFAQGSIARLLCSVVLVYLGFGIIGLIFGYILGEFLTFLFQKELTINYFLMIILVGE
jgi:O-antigen/teichoic acid export membrane protein